MKAAIFLALSALLAAAPLVAATGARAEDSGDDSAAVQTVVETDLTGGVGATSNDPGDVVVIQMLQSPAAASAANTAAANLRFSSPAVHP